MNPDINPNYSAWSSPHTVYPDKAGHTQEWLISITVVKSHTVWRAKLAWCNPNTLPRGLRWSVLPFWPSFPLYNTSDTRRWTHVTPSSSHMSTYSAAYEGESGPQRPEELAQISMSPTWAQLTCCAFLQRQTKGEVQHLLRLSGS